MCSSDSISFLWQVSVLTLEEWENATCLQTPPNLSSGQHIVSCGHCAPLLCFWGKDCPCYVYVQYQGTTPFLIWDDFVLMQYPVEAMIVFIHLHLEWKQLKHFLQQNRPIRMKLSLSVWFQQNSEIYNWFHIDLISFYCLSIFLISHFIIFFSLLSLTERFFQSGTDPLPRIQAGPSAGYTCCISK